MKKAIHKDHFPPVIENLIIFAILLVIVHTVVEDLGAIYNWSYKTMTIIMIAGFFFDLLFSLEFVARSVVSAKRGEFAYYIEYQRGWVDLLSSLPLLFLVSGPALILYLNGSETEGAGLGFFSILKTAKAIRVTRILRLIRVLKLFGRIQNTDSQMANRHMATISTISVVTMVLVLVITQFTPFARVGDHEEYLKQRKTDLALMLAESAQIDWAKKYIEKSPQNQDVIELRNRDGEIIYSSPDKADLMHKSYNHGKPIRISENYSVVLSYFPAEAMHAKSNMLIFISILSIIMAIVFFYSRIFVQQVTDPLYVMDKGFRDWEYNLAVKDNKNFAEDEVFSLARIYNIKWLPLKNQIRAFRAKKKDVQEKSKIKMDDLF